MAAVAIDPQGTVDMVALTNYKSLAEMVTVNAIQHQNRVNLIAEGSLGQILNSIAQSQTSVPEGLGLQTASQSGLSGQIASLAAAVAGMQALIKGGQTVPPVTG